MSLVVFVATRREDVPKQCRCYASVDGSVPGASVIWDHHVTGEAINLDALPAVIEPSLYDGVGTTLADTDALVSVVAVLLGGPARLEPRVLEILRAASHLCDHLVPLPQVDEEIGRLGHGLHGYVWGQLRAARDVSAAFAGLCGEVADCIAMRRPLPSDSSVLHEQDALAAQLDQQGRFHRRGEVALLDVRGRRNVYAGATYARLSSRVAVMLDDHHTAGGRRYTVGVNPFVQDAPSDLRPALVALARAEFAHGAPAVLERPGPGSENWGGRATVFGSPWNYGSRLEPEEVLELVAKSLGLSLDRA